MQMFLEMAIDRKEGRKKSLASDVQRLRDHILPAIGNRKLSEITPGDIHKMIRKVKDKTSPSTANRCIALVKHLLRLEMKDRSPAIDLKPYPEPPSRDIVLHRDEIIRLIAACDADSNKMTASLFKMAMFTGRRPGELRDAKWEHIDLERGVWRLPETKAGEQQFVPLSANAREILGALPRINNNPYVFVGLKLGKPIQHYYRAWRRILNRAGLAHMPAYGLRHNFASLLVADDVPLAIVRQLMGHKSIQTTMRYTHLRQDHLMQATDKFGEIISFPESKRARNKA